MSIFGSNLFLESKKYTQLNITIHYSGWTAYLHNHSIFAFNLMQFAVYWLVWLNCCFCSIIECKQSVELLRKWSDFPNPLLHICYARLERLTSLQSPWIAARFVESTTNMNGPYPARSLPCAARASPSVNKMLRLFMRLWVWVAGAYSKNGSLLKAPGSA